MKQKIKELILKSMAEAYEKKELPSREFPGIETEEPKADAQNQATEKNRCRPLMQ